MWPFRRRRDKKKKIVKNVIVGLIIGGAIASIVGKKMLEHEQDEDMDQKK